jgi:hypothetical protein
MNKGRLIGKKVLVKEGANEDLAKCGFYSEDMDPYIGQVGIVKQYFDFGSTPDTHYLVCFPNGAEWGYHEEFLEEQ